MNKNSKSRDPALASRLYQNWSQLLDWARYAHYSQQIRREYRMYPQMLYPKGRKRVLEGLLARPLLFI